MISVIATIEVEPGTREQLLAEFAKIVDAVRAEEGCLMYIPSVDVDAGFEQHDSGPRENVVVVVEQWESVEALRAHLAAPHMVQYRERVGSIVRSIDLQVLRPAVG